MTIDNPRIISELRAVLKALEDLAVIHGCASIDAQADKLCDLIDAIDA